jgi:hypothetical protein
VRRAHAAQRAAATDFVELARGLLGSPFLNERGSYRAEVLYEGGSFFRLGAPQLKIAKAAPHIAKFLLFSALLIGRSFQ